MKYQNQTLINLENIYEISELNTNKPRKHI